MKLFSLIISFCIFGYILSLDPTNKIYDIKYSEEYIIDVEKEPILNHDNLYFRMKIDTNEEIGITIKMLEEEEQYSIKAFTFTEFPTEEDIINQKDSSKPLDYWYKGIVGIYGRFIYYFEVKNVKYVVIYLNIISDLKYLSISVSHFILRRGIVRDIEFNKEYIYDSESISVKETYFYFYLTFENYKDGEIKIKLHKDDTNDITISAYGSTQYGGKITDSSQIKDSRTFNGPDTSTTDSDYTIYTYSYTKYKETCKFFTVHLYSSKNYQLKYFSIIVTSGSYKLSGLCVLGLFAFLVLLF